MKHNQTAPKSSPPDIGTVEGGEKRSISDQAAEKLEKEMQNADKVFSGRSAEFLIKKALASEVGKMLIKFCYQDEEFAQAVVRSENELFACIKAIAQKVTRDKPALSDVEAYAEAVKFYLPAAVVSVSFRVTLPNELDDDLLFLNNVPESSETEGDDHHAIILDLFGTGEV